MLFYLLSLDCKDPTCVCHLISWMQRPCVILSLVYKHPLSCHPCYTKTLCHLIPGLQRPYVILSLVMQRPYVILSLGCKDPMSSYAWYTKALCHVIPAIQRPYGHLISGMQVSMSSYPCYAKTYLILTLVHVYEKPMLFCPWYAKSLHVCHLIHGTQYHWNARTLCHHIPLMERPYPLYAKTVHMVPILPSDFLVVCTSVNSVH